MLATASTSAYVIRRALAGKTMASRSGYFRALSSSRVARLYVADMWPPSVGGGANLPTGHEMDERLRAARRRSARTAGIESTVASSPTGPRAWMRKR